jgi:cytochrome P450
MSANVAESVRFLRSEEGRRDPFPIYADLHQLGEVSRIDPNAGDRYQVVVHGYHAVNGVLRDPSFHVTDGAMLERQGSRWREHPSLSALLTSMFFSNGVDHARLRGLFSRAMTPRRIAELQAPIERIVADLMERLAERSAAGEPVDFMREFAFPMPGNVICELMGVPDGDRSWFIPRAHIFADLLDLGTSSPDLLQRANAATVELTEYFDDLVAQRQAKPTGDMISELAKLQQTSDRIEHPELLSGLLTFFNAGFATTSHLLGNGLSLLGEYRETLAGFTGRPELAAGYVEEVLRIDPPTHFVVRVATEERRLANVTVVPGDLLLVLIGAANYDPARFPAPERFDPRRPDNRALTFGAGLHFCLGAALTRLEGQVAFPMLFRRFPKIAATGQPTTTDRLTLHGYETLPVTLN